ncbi:MAG TPA: trypsin-like serine protease, partial [Thermoanaerobaculia bacterium]|nr:trypsin-like serine protease [Thermoanaerobaculia bacterium]
QQFPSVGYLILQGTLGTGYCSGTLIGCQTFLTAAHCICGDPVSGQILNGKQCNARPDLLDPKGKRVFFQHAGLFEVAGIVVHPRFQFRLRSDLALVTLARPVTGIGTSRVDLVQKPATGTPATIVGFGADGNGSLSGIKRAGAVTTAPCVGVNDATHVCFTFDNPLGAPGSNSDTCQGDSGGPLFLNFGTSEVVAGVTSGGDGQGCHPTDHSFDADVFLDRAWLQARGGVDLDRGFCGDLTPAGAKGSAVLGRAGTLDATTPQQGLTFDVPAGTERLRLALNAESGADFVFSARAGGRPAPQSFDCRSETAGAPAFCEVLAPAPGPWHLLVSRGGREPGAATKGAFQLTATLLSHLAPAGPCIPSATVLCLGQGRFRVEATWQTVDGTIGAAATLPLSELDGFFSFFDPANIEVAVKVLDGCSSSRHFWVLAAGLTDVRTLLRVTDTASGATRTYLSPQGTPFGPVMDTAAFLCP